MGQDFLSGAIFPDTTGRAAALSDGMIATPVSEVHSMTSGPIRAWLLRDRARWDSTGAFFGVA